MTDDFYLIAITALLPLTAVMLVLQVNPYQALVMRGILGAIAALVYALFGAADVALTEALVGTMLSITLYAVAVRSSMEMRLGWVQSPILDTIENQALGAEANTLEANTPSERELQPAGLDQALVNALKSALKLEHLRLEMVSYSSQEALEIALQTKRIHSMVLPAASNPAASNGSAGKASSYKIQTRVKRLHEILHDRLPPEFAQVDYVEEVQAPSAPAAAQPNLSPSTQESL